MVHTAVMLPKGAEMHPKGVAISEGGEPRLSGQRPVAKCRVQA